MKDVNVVLSAVVVVAAVLVALLLAVKTYNTGAVLDGGWLTLLVMVFGAALGVPNVRKAREERERQAAEQQEQEPEKKEALKNET